MLKTMTHTLRNAAVLTLALLIICGFLYPMLVTGIGQLFFPHQANGSIVEVDGKAVGSSLLGQDFTEARFLKCRPSAVNYNTYTKEQQDSGDYGGVGSGSNNYASSNPDLVARVQADIDAFLAANPGTAVEDLPADLMTASGSGLDPHISVASALVQLPAVSVASGISEADLKAIVGKHTTGKFLGIFGEETVNVLAVNLDIYQLTK